MKNKIMVFILFAFTTILYIIPIASFATEPEPFSGYNKIDTQIRSMWRENTGPTKMNDVYFPCFIKVTPPVTPEKIEGLKTAGVEITGQSISIVIGKIFLAKVPSLVALDFVVSVEGAMIVRNKNNKHGHSMWK